MTSGDPAHLKCVLEETPSELLQLAGICADAALYPDLTAGKAVLRRSHFLDHMLLRENRQPVFLALDEATQHAVGNRLLQELARTADPQNPAHGLRLVTLAIRTRRAPRLGRRLHQTRSCRARARTCACARRHFGEAEAGTATRSRMSTHPDEVLQQMRESASTRTVRSLEKIHEVCRTIHQAGGKDYSAAAVGRRSQQIGGPSADTLYTTAGKPFRALIAAWDRARRHRLRQSQRAARRNRLAPAHPRSR